tara:strand:- start:407 stop:868 length:462 start_codon:yes stop_codon:yes gene_type:complete
VIYKIVTSPRLINHPSIKNSETSMVFDPSDTIKNIETISAISSQKIEIYDYTYTVNHNNGDIISVAGHINKTGNNPLIGHQKYLDKPFVDLSNLYNTPEGVTTECLGKYFDKHKQKHLYPSTYLCYIAIIARAYHKKTIRAFLINNLIDFKND